MEDPKSQLFESWQTPYYWKGTFAYRLRELLDPQSELATLYPYHHRILKTRLEAACIAPGYGNISRCTHTNIPGYEGLRCHGSQYQQQEDTHYMDILDPIPNDAYCRAQHICSDLTDRMEIYGLAGTGCEFPLSSILFSNFANRVQLLPQYTLRESGDIRVKIQMTFCIMLLRWKSIKRC